MTKSLLFQRTSRRRSLTERNRGDLSEDVQVSPSIRCLAAGSVPPERVRDIEETCAHLTSEEADVYREIAYLIDGVESHLSRGTLPTSVSEDEAQQTYRDLCARELALHARSLNRRVASLPMIPSRSTHSTQ